MVTRRLSGQIRSNLEGWGWLQSYGPWGKKGSVTRLLRSVFPLPLSLFPSPIIEIHRKAYQKIMGT